MDFTGKTALVTGAASGIGLATATLLARAGAQHLTLVDRHTSAPEQARFACPVARHTGDVADPSFWASLDLGTLDLAVISAGVVGAGQIATLDFAEWRRVLSANLDGAFLSLQAAMRAMLEGGAIVAVASVAGLKAEPGVAAYAASKAGLLQLMRIAAKEGAPRRIRVNAIAPGGVETPLWDAMPEFADRAAAIGRGEAFAEMATASTALGRFARDDEVAAQIAFLLSDAAATITGAVLVADGGYTL